jgi:hypothetical protein
MDHADIGGMQVKNMPAGSNYGFQFRRDHSFVLTIGGTKQKGKGSWQYKAAQGVIDLMVDGRAYTTITRLGADELTMHVNTPNGVSNSTDMVFKPKSE